MPRSQTAKETDVMYLRKGGSCAPPPTKSAELGQAMAEFMLLSSFAVVALFSMPAITEYALKRMQTVSAARLVAWQRTIWLPSPEVVSRDEERGVIGAMRKNDEDLVPDIIRHIFRDRKVDSMTIHDSQYAEFERKAPAIAENTTMQVKTSSVAPPVVVNALDAVISNVRKAQVVLGGTDLTQSLQGFTFMGGGYFRSEVNVSHKIASFSMLPEATMAAQMTMLTEPWNAGGTVREERKIQGLVMFKLLDAPIWKQFRDGQHQLAYSVKFFLPGFDINKLLWGFTPGDAFEKSPLDRFELTSNNSGQNNVNKFRYYRSFPPPPVVNTMP